MNHLKNLGIAMSAVGLLVLAGCGNVGNNAAGYVGTAIGGAVHQAGNAVGHVAGNVGRSAGAVIGNAGAALGGAAGSMYRAGSPRYSSNLRNFVQQITVDNTSRTIQLQYDTNSRAAVYSSGGGHSVTAITVPMGWTVRLIGTGNQSMRVVPYHTPLGHTISSRAAGAVVPDRSGAYSVASHQSGVGPVSHTGTFRATTAGTYAIIGSGQYAASILSLLQVSHTKNPMFTVAPLG